MVTLNALRGESVSESHRRRFWKFVEKGDGCWAWLGAVPSNAMPYGRFVIKGRRYMAHRVAFALVNGDVPSGLVVMHVCDNPRCVRPDHLKLGTIVENRLDCVAKGRHGRGEKMRAAARARVARLTPEQRRDHMRPAHEATRAMVASRERDALGRFAPNGTAA